MKYFLVQRYEHDGRGWIPGKHLGYLKGGKDVRKWLRKMVKKNFKGCIGHDEILMAVEAFDPKLEVNDFQMTSEYKIRFTAIKHLK